MLTDARVGFIEYGHLAGVRAFIGVIDSQDVERSISVDRFVDEALRLPLMTYLMVSGRRRSSGETACLIAQHLFARQRPIAACVTPGAYLPLNRLAYESTLRVTEGDVIAAYETEEFDDRYASVSIHTWPGSGLLNRIAKDVEAPLGCFLYVAGDDLGQAKVWLHGSPTSRWRVLPYHPLNDLEPAEIAEMANGTRYDAA